MRATQTCWVVPIRRMSWLIRDHVGGDDEGMMTELTRCLHIKVWPAAANHSNRPGLDDDCGKCCKDKGKPSHVKEKVVGGRCWCETTVAAGTRPQFRWRQARLNEDDTCPRCNWAPDHESWRIFDCSANDGIASCFVTDTNSLRGLAVEHSNEPFCKTGLISRSWVPLQPPPTSRASS